LTSGGIIKYPSMILVLVARVKQVSYINKLTIICALHLQRTC
jgi:hypothetical protein